MQKAKWELGEVLEAGRDHRAALGADLEGKVCTLRGNQGHQSEIRGLFEIKRQKNKGVRGNSFKIGEETWSLQGKEHEPEW